MSIECVDCRKRVYNAVLCRDHRYRCRPHAKHLGWMLYWAKFPERL